MSTPSLSLSIMWLSVNKLRSEMLQLSIIIIIPLRLLRHFPELIPKLLRGYNYSKFTIILRVHHHWHILCQPYSVIIGGYHLGLFTQHLDPQLCISGYRHAWNNLLLLSHVYSMSQFLLVVYSLYTSLYYPSFESRLSSSNLFPELNLSFVFTTH